MRVAVRVVPRSAKNTLTWGEDHTLQARLTAPPVEGAANQALIALLAERLALPQRSITIIRGAHSRQKLVEIADLTLEEVQHRLAQ